VLFKVDTAGAAPPSLSESIEAGEPIAAPQNTPLVQAEFEDLVRTHRSRIFRFALASLRDTDAAHTIVQDCFLKAFQARERFRGACSLETWLMTIAANLVRDQARNRRLRFWKRTSQESVPEEVVGRVLRSSAPSAEKQLLLEERVRAVWRSAGELPDRQRTVFLLRFVEEMDLAEIARVTGMREGTVKIHLFRAVRAVRKRVGDVA